MSDADLVDRINAFYERNPAGGSLHVVLDDDNVEDQWLSAALADPEAAADPEAVMILLALSMRTEAERALIVATASARRHEDQNRMLVTLLGR